MTILERLKAATGPDRELDFWISARAWDPSHHTDAELQADIDLVGIEGMVIDKPFTSSVDAALALVERLLPDSRGDVHWGNRGAKASVLCSDGSRTYHEGATPSLAILKSLFTALAKESKP